MCASDLVGHREGIRSKSVNAWDPWGDLPPKESKRSQISTIVDSWEYTSKESFVVEECKEEI